MHVKALAFQSDANVGLYGFATNTYCILGNTVPEQDVEIVKKLLQVPVYQAHIVGTALAGVFLVGTDEKLFVPDVVFDSEKAKLQTIADELAIELVLVPTTATALGNNVCIKNNTAFVSSEVDEAARDCFIAHGLDVVELDLADTTVVGSCIVATDGGILVHPHITEEEAKSIESAFNGTITQGTVNYGSPYVRSGVIANKHGFIIGSLSSGPEITNADEAFGFVNTK